MSGASVGQTVWDPIAGELGMRREVVAAPGQRIVLPQWVASLGLLVAIGGLGLAGWSYFTGEEPWLGVALFVAGFGMAIVPSILAREQAVRMHLYAGVAEELGWGFERMATSFGEAKALKADGAVITGPLPKGDDYTDPRVAAVAQRVPELFRPRLGQLVALRIEAVFRGTQAGAGTRAPRPFWLGLHAMTANAALGSASVRQDEHGGEGAHGTMLTLCVAFPLDRDTGVRAALLSEGPGGDGDDDDTESVAFNDAFSIEVDEGSRAALFQVLTPAVQTALIDLKERYGAQAVIDGPTIWLSGNDRLMGGGEARLAAHLDEVVAEFTKAGTAFAHYAE